MSWFNAVSEDYFKALGIPVLAGRDFDTRDTPTSPPVAIVSQSMAQKFFGTPNAVGRTFQTMEGREMGAPVTVIGVVGNTKYRSLRDSLTPVVYLPRAQGARGDERVNFVLFVEAPDAAMPTVRQAVAETAPRATITMNTLERQLDRSMPVMRATATVSGFFGGLALVLATIGLYGLMSYSVARRRNEIGVRIALGAERGRVVRMVLSDVSRVVATGIVIGVGLSFAATKLVASFIYDVRRNDPATLSGSALVLFAIGAAAAAWPAWRAASIDPVSALREE
jgi:predicted permease